MRFLTSLWTIVLLGVCTSVSAQSSVKSIAVSFSPFGITNSQIGGGDWKYKFKSIMAESFSFEVQSKGLTSLTELSCAHGKFDDYEINRTTDIFNPYDTQNFLQASFTQYVGYTINHNKRLQFPIYLGLGGSYVKGGAIHNFSFDLAAKVRIKFYISNRFGIFAGATGRYGFGSRKEERNDAKEKEAFDIGHFLFTPEAGLIYSF